MRLKLVTFYLLFGCLQIQAQHQNIRSKSDIGIFAGGMYYIGDLNRLNHFKNSNFTYGLMYRYNVHSRMALRINYFSGEVEAYDSESSNQLYMNRNLSFSSKIKELTAGIEFNFLPYQTGHKTFFWTPYLFAELGGFHFNPTTKYNGDTYELQPLGTEGQGTSLSKDGLYKKTQVCIPVGVGIKLSLLKNLALNVEFGVRKTFTDYIDDVKSSRYINRNDLSAINGPLVAELSNRSLDQSPNGMRGNPATKDWYFVFGGMLTYRLGPPDKCSFRN